MTQFETLKVYSDAATYTQKQMTLLYETVAHPKKKDINALLDKALALNDVVNVNRIVKKYVNYMTT